MIGAASIFFLIISIVFMLLLEKKKPEPSCIVFPLINICQFVPAAYSAD
jgi:hypothetical protein